MTTKVPNRLPLCPICEGNGTIHQFNQRNVLRVIKCPDCGGRGTYAIKPPPPPPPPPKKCCPHCGKPI